MKEYSLLGVVVQGEREASGLAYESASLGTIALQKPFLLAAGVKRIESCYDGTINVNISPQEFVITKPDYVVDAKEWEPGTSETFWLVSVHIEHKGKRYPAYVYYPLPSAVKAHPDFILELVTGKIESLAYGDVVTVHLPSESISLK